MYDENSSDVFALDVIFNNGEPDYSLNSLKVKPKEEDIIYKYKINKEIKEQAENIYEECEQFIIHKNNCFSFIFNSIKYETPLYLLILVNAMSKIKDDNYNSSLLKNMSLTDEEFKNILAKTDVKLLIEAAVAQFAMKTLHWLETIEFKN